jgi:hypothetical protein
MYMAMNPNDAHLLKGILEGESIGVVFQGEFLWTTPGETVAAI